MIFYAFLVNVNKKKIDDVGGFWYCLGMTKSELLNRLTNKKFDKENNYGVKIHKINKNLPTKNITQSDSSAFSVFGFESALINAFNNTDIDEIHYVVMLGEIIVLIDKLPDEKGINKINEIFYNFIPVSVSLEIHEIEFDKKLLDEPMRLIL